MGDGLCVLEGGVGPIPPHILPDELLLLMPTPEGDPGLPRQLLPLVDRAPEIVLPESALQRYFRSVKFSQFFTIAIDWSYPSL